MTPELGILVPPKTPRELQPGLLVGLGLALLAVFCLTSTIAGVTWDESTHRHGFSLQIEVAKLFLNGSGGHFSSVPRDLEFYGILPVGIAELGNGLYSSMTGVQLGDHGFGILLHSTTFFFYVCALPITFAILGDVARLRWTPAVGTALVASYPLWFGYALFDYKDVPTAVFCLALCSVAFVSWHPLLQESCIPGPVHSRFLQLCWGP